MYISDVFFCDILINSCRSTFVSDMSLSNDFANLELSDDIDSIFFLCDRLNKRLNQVSSYIDEIKQLWMEKRRSLESDSNINPLIIHKAVKFNKVLLSVAEKLAAVELQTESLNSLCASSNESSQMSLPTTLSRLAINHNSKNKIEPINDENHLQRDTISNPTRSLMVASNLMNHTFTARNTTTTLFNEIVPTKSSIEQQLPSAFHPPTSRPSNAAHQPMKSSPQSSIHSYSLSSKNKSNGYQKNATYPEISNEIDIVDDKVRVKMQVIPSGTVWRQAHIPTIDHPSAFFVSNQDPRVAEQFRLMSMEMK